MENYRKQANKGCQQLILNPEIGFGCTCGKKYFQHKGDLSCFQEDMDLFQVLEGINDNGYKLDFPSEYNVSATFNVTDLSPFDIGDDLRTNPFQEEGNDEGTTNKWNVDPIWFGYKRLS